MAILQINNNLARKMKKRGFFGDYILARRLQPLRVYPRIPLSRLIDNQSTFRWNRTPQGYWFWEYIYDKITD